MSFTVRQATIAALDFLGVEIELHRAAAELWMLTGAGGNVGVLADGDAALLVDGEFAPLTPKVREAVASVSAAPIRYLVNTHFHLDHTGGNELLGRDGAVIVAHENVRSRMRVEQPMEAMGRTIPAFPPAALPAVTFEDHLSLHVGGHEVRIVHVSAAHTDGDVVVYFPTANVVHMGDLFFNGSYPLLDLGNGGHVDGVLEAARRVLADSDGETRIMPGHGPLAGRDELAAYADMLSEVRARVAELMEAGRSRDEVLAARPTAPFDEEWASELTGPDSITGTVHDSLARER